MVAGSKCIHFVYEKENKSELKIFKNCDSFLWWLIEPERFLCNNVKRVDSQYN